MLMEIRDKNGIRRAAADTLEEVITQLLSSCETYEETIRQHYRLFDEFFALEPDVSAIAPQCVDVFSNGWRSCRRQAPFWRSA